MNKKMYILATLIVVVLLSGCTDSTSTGIGGGSKIKDIVTNPGKYEGSEVTVSGKVIDDGQGFGLGYKINDGSESILVKSEKKVKLNEQVTVKGFVKAGPVPGVGNVAIIDATGYEK